MIGYSSNEIANSNQFGKIYLANTNGIISILTLTSKTTKGFVEDGGIIIYSEHSQDKFYDNHEFELLSATGANSYNDLPNFYLQINHVKTIIVTIEQGLFFGNEAKEQSLDVDVLNH